MFFESANGLQTPLPMSFSDVAAAYGVNDFTGLTYYQDTTGLPFALVDYDVNLAAVDVISALNVIVGGTNRVGRLRLASGFVTIPRPHLARPIGFKPNSLVQFEQLA